MKVQSVKSIKSAKPIKVSDCFVERGYVKRAHGSLP
jgi:hypothetical protein